MLNKRYFKKVKKATVIQMHKFRLSTHNPEHRNILHAEQKFEGHRIQKTPGDEKITQKIIGQEGKEKLNHKNIIAHLKVNEMPFYA